ncbi:tail length tape-measure protein [Escherichia phage UPEC06]|nr:tail length tape-measure protein [Escherichia phage UPEC06]
MAVEVIATTKNRVIFETDKGSYRKAREEIRKLSNEWKKASTEATAAGKNSPAEAYKQSAREMRLVSKRLEETRKREEKKATDYRIALAKKEAKAKEAIQKVSAARIRQQVKSLTAASPGSAEMRKFYQEQEKAARAAARSANRTATPLPPFNIQRVEAANQLLSRGNREPGSGIVGDPNSRFNPDLIAAQNRAMQRSSRIKERMEKQQTQEQERERVRAARAAARIDDVTAQQRIRLSSRYGRGYAGALGRDSEGRGIEDLNRQFRAGTLSSGQYRQSIQALERQFRAAQSSAGSFSSTLKDVRSSLVSATAAYGVFSAGASITRQGQFFEGINATSLLISDSAEEAGQRVKFVRDEAYRLGLDLKTASQGFTQLAISADGVISKSQTDELFSAFSEYSTALQVDPVRYQRGITAIQQILGKGQVMAEELKGQLAEAIPGSLQVFLKATQEAFGDTSIDIAKLLKLMEDGELKASKIIPLVGKYYAEAANKGGALDKALESNRVAYQRLTQTFAEFQNKIFQGGFGEQLTRVFNNLATILSSNGNVASTIGRFFGNVIEGFTDMVLEIHDNLVLLDRVVTYYFKKIGVEGETLRQVFDWGSYLLGIGLFLGGLTKVFNILAKIAGLKGALKEIRGTLGGDLATGGKTSTGASTTASGGAGTPGQTSVAGRFSQLGKLGKLFGLGTLYSAGSEINDRFIQSGESRLAGAGLDATAFQQQYGVTPQPVGLTDVFMELFGGSRDITVDPNTISTPSGIRPSGFPLETPAAPPEGKITVEIKSGEIRQYIRAIVDEENGFNINLLTQGGNQ